MWLGKASGSDIRDLWEEAVEDSRRNCFGMEDLGHEGLTIYSSYLGNHKASGFSLDLFTSGALSPLAGLEGQSLALDSQHKAGLTS